MYCGSFLGYEEIQRIKHCTGEYLRTVHDKDKMIPARTQWARELISSEPIWTWVIEGVKWSEIVREVFKLYEIEFGDRAFIVFEAPVQDIIPVSETECRVLDVDRGRGLYPAIVSSIPARRVIYEPEIFVGDKVTDYISGVSITDTRRILNYYNAGNEDLLFSHTKL